MKQSPLLRLRRLSSRIWLRLLAFNLLLVFLPLLVIFVSKAYERQLRDRQERAMVQQGRLVAAALGEQGRLDPDDARELIERLQGRTQGARLRVIDRDGQAIADTAIFGPDRDGEAELAERTGSASELEESPLYRLGAFPFRLFSRLKPKPPLAEGDDYEDRNTFDGPEVAKALAGAYGADTRATPGGQRSVTFYIAIPIRSDTEVVGAALVSQSTYFILRDLYEVRLAIFKVFLGAIAGAIVLSFLVATTIAAPLRRLRQQATNLLDARGRLRGEFAASKRLDEIGDLQRALGQLSRRLSEHQAFTESFAADLSHEFKNPLASIRSATDVLRDIDTSEERDRFVSMIQNDTARLERLLSSLREITTIDAGSGHDDTEVRPITELTRLVTSGWAARHPEFSVELFADERPLSVRISPHRFAQVIDNLLDNAAGFTGPGPDSDRPRIDVRVGFEGHEAVVQVQDYGPGIAPQHVARVFDRFFSYRRENRSNPDSCDNHSGLGLAIVKSIAESYGGRVGAHNAATAGAVFTVYLPLT